MWAQLSNNTKAHKTRVQDWEMLNKSTKGEKKKKKLLALLIAKSLGFMQFQLQWVSFLPKGYKSQI